LDIYELKMKIVVYVEDEGSNLNIMTITLKLIISYDVLGLEKHFSSNLSWSCIFLKYVNMQQKMKKFVKA
jgi:hypothetical protein